MSYVLDDELPAIAPHIPAFDLTDVEGTRESAHRIMSATPRYQPEQPLTVEHVVIPGHHAGPDVAAREYRPAARAGLVPGLIYLQTGRPGLAPPADLAVLAVLVLAIGTALTLLPIGALRLAVGSLPLVYGLQWLRKGIRQVNASGFRGMGARTAAADDIPATAWTGSRSSCRSRVCCSRAWKSR